MPSALLPIEQILTLLAEQPLRIAALTADLPSAQLHTAPNEDEWSLNNILAHLRSCADMWGGSIARIIAEDNPTLRAINPRTWIDQTDYLEQDFRTSLRAFMGQREELVAALNSLSPEDWSRSATVTVAGKPLVRTVHSYADWLATHERSHVKHIARMVKTMHV